MSAPTDPLARLDPAEAWKPWQPSAANPFNLKWAGHLYRRATFGATIEELRQAVERGPSATLDLLLHGDRRAAQREPLLAQSGEAMARNDDESAVRGWWLYAMLHSGHPLREKMTLFWHNHFATSNAKVRSTELMVKQNQTLRRHALGKFRPLLAAVSQDPAMLIWLDGNRNLKNAPNENYAREMFELFTLGVGHYTEREVRESARAFTGWHTDGEQFAFDPRQHDTGSKTIFGKTGNLDGGDVQKLALEHPACARFLVRKLYRYLVRETSEPPEALLEPLAERFRKTDYDVGDLVGTILRSRHFFSEYAYRQRLKTPVEYVVGLVRAVLPNPAPPRELLGPLEAMGQNLFEPPNVKGWVGGRTWLNSATLLARQNFAEAVASGYLGGRRQVGGPFIPAQGGPVVEATAVDSAVPPNATPVPVPASPKGEPPVVMPLADGKMPPPPPEPPTSTDPVQLLRREKATDPLDAVSFLVEMLLQGDLPTAARERLTKHLKDTPPKNQVWLNHRIREVLHALLAMPEFQLA